MYLGLGGRAFQTERKSVNTSKITEESVINLTGPCMCLEALKNKSSSPGLLHKQMNYSVVTEGF